jgi:hypothetical protein
MNSQLNPLNRPDEQKNPVNNVVQILEKICPFVDRVLFSKYSITARAGAYLFALCSTITYFFIFTPLGNHLTGLLWFLSLAPTANSLALYLWDILLPLLTDQLSPVTAKWGGVHRTIYWMPIFQGVLTQLIILNMALVSTPSVREEIDRRFGLRYVKSKGYNHPTTTLEVTRQLTDAPFRKMFTGAHRGIGGGVTALLGAGALSIGGVLFLINKKLDQDNQVVMEKGKMKQAELIVYFLLKEKQLELDRSYNEKVLAIAEKTTSAKKWSNIWTRGEFKTGVAALDYQRTEINYPEETPHELPEALRKTINSLECDKTREYYFRLLQLGLEGIKEGGKTIAAIMTGKNDS